VGRFEGGRLQTHVEAYPSGLNTSLKNAHPITSACTEVKGGGISLYAEESGEREGEGESGKGKGERGAYEC